MKNAVFIPVILASVLLLSDSGKFRAVPERIMNFDRNVASCGSVSGYIQKDDGGRLVPVLPGWGHHTYPISTKVDSARLFFDQGLNFYYSYHFREALASFREAARLDKNSPMVYWGQALAMGPYYNNYYYKMDKRVPAVLDKMTSLQSGASEKEKDLIEAMQQRYSADTTNTDRDQLDGNYAAAMRLLVIKYPDDNDVKALYIDAVMLHHKWDFWNNDDKPKAWTPELLQLCRSIFKSDAAHPAALHYYIHLTEASSHPEVALPVAEILKRTMPGVGHMVHMATHSYQRNGLFSKGVAVNEEANTVNNHVDSMAPSLKLGQNNLIHVYAVQSYCAMSAGMDSRGEPVYRRTRNRLLAQQPGFDKDPYAQYIYMIPVTAWVRLGKWDEILHAPAPDAQWKYARVLDDFAKGLAYVRRKNITAAKRCLVNLRKNLQDSLLDVRLMPFNRPKQCGTIAFELLTGEIFLSEGKPAQAIAAFKNAVAEEDKLIYREPQDWMLPARQYLGSALLKLNRAAEAVEVYQNDLAANPGNGWSQLGMYQSLAAQQKVKEATKYRSAYQRAFTLADAVPRASVY